MKTDHRVVTFKIPVNDKKAMQKFQNAVDQIQDRLAELVTKEANELGISEADMGQIMYYRSRSRWTKKGEKHLIKLAKESRPLPNVLAGEF